MSFRISLHLSKGSDGTFTQVVSCSKVEATLPWARSPSGTNLSEDQRTHLNQSNNFFLIHRDPGRLILLREPTHIVLTTIASINHDNPNIKASTHKRNKLLGRCIDVNIATAQESYDQTLLQLLRIRDDVFTFLYYCIAEKEPARIVIYSRRRLLLWLLTDTHSCILVAACSCSVQCVARPFPERSTSMHMCVISTITTHVPLASQ